jgi:hypothetical protein
VEYREDELRRSAALGLIALATLSTGGAAATQQHRLPPGTKWGRCLLVVDGQTRISGKCSYRIYKGGDFHIDGPRQVFDGIDYPKAVGMADKMSRDYWADVFREDGAWTGYGNTGIRDVHGDRNWDLRRDGACYVGKGVRVCLWRQ